MMNAQTNERTDRKPAYRVVLREIPGGRTMALTEPVESVGTLRARVAQLEAENATLRARVAALSWLP